jgi:hypothetical protein
MQSEFQHKLSEFLKNPNVSRWEEIKNGRFSEFEASQVVADMRNRSSLRDAQKFPTKVRKTNQSETSKPPKWL